MAKFGLDTFGSSRILKQRFVDFWRNSASLLAKPALTGAIKKPVAQTTTACPVGDESDWKVSQSVQMLTHERDSVREILGLSPDADTNAVKRVLASLARTSIACDRKEEVYPQSAPPMRYSYDPIHVELPQQRPIASTRVAPSGSGAPPDFSFRPNFLQRNQNFRPDSLTLQSRLPPAANPTPGLEMRTAVHHNPGLDVSSLCNLVRKWNLKFDGRRDPVSFLERLEELIESYEVPRDSIAHALPELLTGSALLWYRNNKHTLHDYYAFRQHFGLQFLPPGYRENLDDEIRCRTQGANEPFRDYVTAVMTLIRRSGAFSQQQKLDVIYRNMRPEYKVMVRKQDCTSLARMMEGAEEYETYLRGRDSFRPPPTPAQALMPETAYYNKRRPERPFDSAAVGDNMKQVKFDMRRQEQRCPRGPSPRPLSPRPPNEVSMRDTFRSRILCWNCETFGHWASECAKPRLVRCYFCKTEGILTGRCKCRQGNDPPARAKGGHTSPADHVSTQPPTSGASGYGK